MCIEACTAVENNLLESRLQSLAFAWFVAHLLKKLAQGGDAVIILSCFRRPINSGLPPVLCITRGPGEAVVIACFRTGDPMIVVSQTWKNVPWNHDGRRPRCWPHFTHA